MQSEDTQVINPNLTVIDGRWFDLGVFDFEEEAEPTRRRSSVLYIAARESIREDDTDRLLNEQILAGVYFAMENCIQHVTCLEQVIPAKGNDIEIHKEMFRLIDFSNRDSEIFVNKTDRASRDVEYGKWFWNEAKRLKTPVHAGTRTFPLNARGRKEWLKEIAANENNNRLRSEGNKKSHSKSKLEKKWRYQPWAGYGFIDGKLQPSEPWRLLAREIATLHNKVGLDFLLSTLRSNNLWFQTFSKRKKVFDYQILKSVICDEKNAGWKRYKDGEVGDLIQGDWEPVFSTEFFIEANLLYPSKEQLALIPPSRAFLERKLRCADCGQRLILSGVFYRDFLTNQILVNKVAYVCPEAFNMHKKKNRTCTIRKIYDADLLHSQIPLLLDEMSKRADRPDDMREKWEIASDEVRALLAKQYFLFIYRFFI